MRATALRLGADLLARLDDAVLQDQQRLDLDQRAQEGLGIPDPAALGQVFERVHDEQDVQLAF